MVKVHNNYVVAYFLYNAVETVAVCVSKGNDIAWINACFIEFPIDAEDVFRQFNDMFVRIFPISIFYWDDKIESVAVF